MPFKDPEKRRAYGREQALKKYQQDPAARQAYMREWRKKNPGKDSSYTRSWEKKNPDKKRAMDKKRLENPVRKEYCRKREEDKRAADPAYKLRGRLRRYGLTLEAFEALLVKQGFVCAICGRGPAPASRLDVDHCHTTGKVRGLLCQRCNKAIGLFKEDLDAILIAYSYLNSSRGL